MKFLGYCTLKSEWNKLMNELGVEANGNHFTLNHSYSQEIFTEIFKRYLEKHRYYHINEHILDCFREFRSIETITENPRALKLGLLGHDLIYDTKRQDNEEKSAELLEKLIVPLNLSYDVIRPAKEIVLATNHKNMPKNIDEALAIDIDLSILGKEKAIFEEYEKNIRKEYSWVSEKDFREGRTKILKYFLNRDSIYYTEFFRIKYEAKARENLNSSIERMFL